MQKQELTSGLASAYGKEKAEEIIDEIITGSGLPLKAEYSKQEMLQVCDFMIGGSDRFLQMIGGFLRARVLLRSE